MARPPDMVWELRGHKDFINLAEVGRGNTEIIGRLKLDRCSGRTHQFVSREQFKLRACGSQPSMLELQNIGTTNLFWQLPSASLLDTTSWRVVRHNETAQIPSGARVGFDACRMMRGGGAVDASLARTVGTEYVFEIQETKGVIVDLTSTTSPDRTFGNVPLSMQERGAPGTLGVAGAAHAVGAAQAVDVADVVGAAGAAVAGSWPRYEHVDSPLTQPTPCGGDMASSSAYRWLTTEESQLAQDHLDELIEIEAQHTSGGALGCPSIEGCASSLTKAAATSGVSPISPISPRATSLMATSPLLPMQAHAHAHAHGPMAAAPSPPSQAVAAMGISHQAGGKRKETPYPDVPGTPTVPPMLREPNGAAREPHGAGSPSGSPRAQRSVSHGYRQQRIPASPFRSSPRASSRHGMPNQAPAAAAALRSSPGSDHGTRNGALPGSLPFPLRFALRAAGLEDLGKLDHSSHRALFEAYHDSDDSARWAAVRRVTPMPSSGVPRIDVMGADPRPRPSAPLTLGFRARVHTGTGSVEHMWPRLRPETKADRTIGAEWLLQVELVVDDAPSGVSAAGQRASGAEGQRAAARPCFNCNSLEHWAKNCPQPRSERGWQQRQQQRQAQGHAGVEAVRKERDAAILRLCEEGVTVCDRLYHFLGVKDAGKKGKRGESETIYFLAVDGPPTDHLPFRGVDEALAALANFERCKTLPKMCARIELAFSGTAPVFESRGFRHVELYGRGGSWAQLEDEIQRLAALASDDEIVVVSVDDILGEDTNRPIALDASKAPRLMSDGNGLISRELAKEVAAALEWEHVPLATQMRLWWGGSVAKGMLTTTSALPANVIVVRSSQVKVEAPPAATAAVLRGSLEVNTCQRQPGEARTSPFLVPLLQAVGGSPLVARLLEMQAEAAKAVSALLEAVAAGRELSKDEVCSLYREFEAKDHDPDLPGSVDPRRMLMAGLDTRDEHLREQALKSLHSKLLTLQQGKFAIPDSVSLIVVVDHTRTLPEGEVVVWMGGHPQLSPGRCLLYKSPGLHPGDVRSMRLSSPTAEMRRHLDFDHNGQFALIVSTRGARSILDMIAGSDADGDCFSVIFNRELVSLLPLSGIRPPWEPHNLPSYRATASCGPPPPLPPALLSSEDRRRQRIEHMLRCRKGQELISSVATAWKVYADEHGAIEERSMQLALLYMDALDAGKAEALPQLPQWADVQPWDVPAHLRKKLPTDAAVRAGKSTRSDDSALYKMYLAVDESIYRGIDKHVECPIPQTDPDLKLSSPRGTRATLLGWWDTYKKHKDSFKELRASEQFGEQWLRAMAAHRSQLIEGGNVAAPDDALMESALTLYESLYKSQGQETCGRCAKCTSVGESNRRISAYKFVWDIGGDLLLFIKANRLHEKRQRAREFEARRAPEAVDTDRFELLMNPRNGRRVAHLQDCARNAEEEEHDELVG